MEGPHGPQTQVVEGACAIKVSMRCSEGQPPAYILAQTRTDHLCLGQAHACRGTSGSRDALFPHGVVVHVVVHGVQTRSKDAYIVFNTPATEAKKNL